MKLTLVTQLLHVNILLSLFCIIAVNTLHVDFETVTLLYSDRDSHEIGLQIYDGDTGLPVENHTIYEGTDIRSVRSVYNYLRSTYYITFECQEEEEDVTRLLVVDTVTRDISYSSQINLTQIFSLTFDTLTEDLLALVKSPNNINNALVSVDPTDGKELWRIELPSSSPVAVGSDLIHGYVTYINGLSGLWSSELITRSTQDLEFEYVKNVADMQFIAAHGHGENASLVLVGRFSRNTNDCGLYKVSILDDHSKPILINSYPPLSTAKIIPIQATSFFDDTNGLFSLLVPASQQANTYKIITTDTQTSQISESAKFVFYTSQINVVGMHAVYIERAINPIAPPKDNKPPQHEEPTQDSGMIGMIIGITIGALALVGIVVGVATFVRRRYSFQYTRLESS